VSVKDKDVVENKAVLKTVLENVPDVVPRTSDLAEAFFNIDGRYEHRMCRRQQFSVDVEVFEAWRLTFYTIISCVCCKFRMWDRSGKKKRSGQKLWAKSEAEKLRLLAAYVRRLKRKSTGSRLRTCTMYVLVPYTGCCCALNC
jgi:hypothetical protein